MRCGRKRRRKEERGMVRVTQQATPLPLSAGAVADVLGNKDDNDIGIGTPQKAGALSTVLFAACFAVV
jgi:hypothetical protein